MSNDLEKMRLEKIKPEKFGDFDRIEDEFLPFLHLTSEQVPELHNWKTGGHYRMVIDIRQDGDHKDKVTGVSSGEFKIVAYKVIKSKSIAEMTDEEFGEFQGQELAKANQRNKSSLANNVEIR